jgi:hypothetical protein
MKFGPAEMAQMMDGARGLITIAMISSVGIGLVLGVISALFVVFSERGLLRDSAEPPLTKGQLLTPNLSSGPNTVYSGEQLAREHPSISADMFPGNRVKRFVFSQILGFLLVTVPVGGGVLYWKFASQRLDAPQRDATQRDTPQGDTPQGDTTQRDTTQRDTTQWPDAPRMPYAPQRPDPLPRAPYSEVYSRLNISPLPEAIEKNAPIRLPLEQLIPSPIDQNRWAHWRNPMDMIRQG